MLRKHVVLNGLEDLTYPSKSILMTFLERITTTPENFNVCQGEDPYSLSPLEGYEPYDCNIERKGTLTTDRDFWVDC